jgi:putative transposase
MREVNLVENEFYHIYNRGVEKRVIFKNQADLERFLQSIKEFNTLKPIGSLYENRPRHRGSPASTASTNVMPENKSPLVEIVAYCINPNHYHFLLKQISEKGIEKFMHRLGTGYSKYFNIKNKRTGPLFQGRFKAKHVDTNEYLLHLSAYINLNNKIHGRGSPASTLWKSSWEEYCGEGRPEPLSNGAMVLEQFSSVESYKKFAEETLMSIIERKILIEELENEEVELVNTFG